MINGFGLIIMIYICSIMNIYQIVRKKELKTLNRIIWVLIAITLLMGCLMNDQSFLNWLDVNYNFRLVIILGNALLAFTTFLLDRKKSRFH